MPLRSSDLQDQLLQFAWSAWTELGVSGWDRHHRDWPIDPEALILLTAEIGHADPRLRNEALDWCSRFPDLLSRARIKTLLKTWPQSTAWPSYAGTLSRATQRAWPLADGEFAFAPSGKSRLDLRKSPALISLRLRAAIGVGTRAEVLRVLLLAPEGAEWTAARIADGAGYTKRNVTEALNAFAAGGWLQEGVAGNARTYRIADRRPWLELFGPLPAVPVDFHRVCRGGVSLLRAAESTEKSTQQIRRIEIRSAVDRDWPAMQQLLPADERQLLESNDLERAIRRIFKTLATGTLGSDID